jgi:hypothetical protein
MPDERPDLEYLAAGYLTGLMARAGHPVEDLEVPTDSAGVVTGELVFVYLGERFLVSPQMLAQEDVDG